MTALDKIYIQLPIKTYEGKSFNDYLKQTRGNDELDEIEKLVREAEQGEVLLPKALKTRIRIKGELISSYTETFSLEAVHINADTPKRDNVEITLEDGVSIVVDVSYSEFEKLFNSWLENKEK